METSSSQVNAYEAFLKASFEKHYNEHTDVWTDDVALGRASEYLRTFLNSPGHVLDIGAGRGRDSAYFLKEGFGVTAVDPVVTPELLALRETPGFSLVAGLFQESRIDSKFVGAIDNGSFHHQDSAQFAAYLGKVYSSLKSGGYFVLTTYTPFEESASGREGVMKDGRKGHSFSVDEIRRQVELTGFKYVESRRILQESGQAYYLAACFQKPVGPSVLLLTPLAKGVQAAAELGLHTTTVWHCLNESEQLYPMLSDIERDSNLFIQADLTTEAGIAAVLAKLDQTEFVEAYYNGPDPYMNAAISIMKHKGLLRNSPEVFEVMHRKDLLRAHLDEVNLSPVKAVKVMDFAELQSAAAILGFPFILKPVSGGNSKNIHLLKQHSDLDGVRSMVHAGSTWIAEEFLVGLQISVEAMTYGAGEHEVLGMTEKFPVLPPFFVENGGVFPARLSAQEYVAAENLLKRMLTSLNYNFGPSHTEMILTADGPRIVETHARSGGLIPFMMEASTGLCMHKSILAAGRCEKLAPVKSEVSVLKFMSFEINRKLKSVSGRQAVAALPFVQKHNVWVQPGQTVPAVTNNEHRHGYIVTAGKDLSEAEARAASALALLQIEYEA